MRSKLNAEMPPIRFASADLASPVRPYRLAGLGQLGFEQQGDNTADEGIYRGKNETVNTWPELSCLSVSQVRLQVHPALRCDPIPRWTSYNFA